MGFATDTRAYFVARVQSVDPDLKEHIDAFNEGNVANINRDTRFFIEYGDLSGSALDDTAIKDNFNVKVIIFSVGDRDPRTALDNLLDKADSIRLECIKISNIHSQARIKNVVLNSITPDFLDSNDNSVKAILDFDVTLICK